MYEYSRITKYDLEKGVCTTSKMLEILTFNADACIRLLEKSGYEGNLYYCPLANPSVVAMDSAEPYVEAEHPLGLDGVVYSGAHNWSFVDGIRKAFDMLVEKAANNYHGNPELQRICDIENDALISAAQDILLYNDIESYNQWRDIAKLTDEIKHLRSQLDKVNRQFSNYQFKVRTGNQEIPDTQYPDGSL